MKKIITLITLFAISIMVAQASNNNTIKDNIQGIWEQGNTQITFVGDSVYFDEIDNEGMGYTYKVINHNTISISNAFDTFNMVIVSLNKTTLQYYFADNPHTHWLFYKKS